MMIVVVRKAWKFTSNKPHTRKKPRHAQFARVLFNSSSSSKYYFAQTSSASLHPPSLYRLLYCSLASSILICCTVAQLTMAPQSGFDYTPKRHAETLKRLQGGLGMNDIEMQELRATIMSEMEKQGLKYCNMKDATTKSKAERVSAVAKVHLAARLGGIPTEWIDHTLWCIIKNLNADTKRRADAGAEIQTGDAKRRKKNKIESTTQSDSKDIPNSESLQGQTNSMDAIIQHPRLGTILSLANQQGVAKYISLHEIIGPDNQPSQALFPDTLDRASFDVFRQTPGVRSLLVDETTHALYCWLPLHQNWIPVEDAATFRALLKQQAVGRESMVFFGIQPRPGKSAATTCRFKH